MAEPLLLAQREAVSCALWPSLANRHGLITGATGTGKTLSLQRLAEQFSLQGVPVFMADVKGDLSGMGQAGQASDKLLQVLAERGLPAPVPMACPVTLWDVWGQQGHPLRATVSDLGPLLWSRLLELNEVQSGVLSVVFKVADDQGLLLLDLKDLRALLQHVAEHARELSAQYGLVSAASVAAIQRGLLQLEQEGVAPFLGEPMLDIHDLMQTERGRGVVNILAADRLLNAPRLYGTVLLWLLSELFETLPEVGDLDKPKLVFFFDEAHLLFKDAPAVLVERIERVVRLVRSKGVGVYFVTQSPSDIPDTVLGQLGHRVQHALRAYSPKDQKAVATAASTMRPNPGLDIGAAITELAVGEALVSLLDPQGRPCPTERVYVLPPGSRIGPLSAAERQALMAQSLVAGVYDTPVDRASAFEALQASAAAPAAATGGGGTVPEVEPAPPRAEGRDLSDRVWGSTGPRGGRRDGLADTLLKSALRSVGSAVGREIVRGVLGSILGGGRRR